MKKKSVARIRDTQPVPLAARERSSVYAIDLAILRDTCVTSMYDNA